MEWILETICGSVSSLLVTVVLFLFTWHYLQMWTKRRGFVFHMIFAHLLLVNSYCSRYLTFSGIQISLLVQSRILPRFEPKKKITCVKAVAALRFCKFLTMRHFSLPPGPIPLPFIGTAYTFPKDLSDIPFVIADFTKKYGGMCTFQEPTGR